jgi:hypothetical protein
MPNYRDLDARKREDRRIADRLLALRNALRYGVEKGGTIHSSESKRKIDWESAPVPRSKRDTNLIIATWNLREFGKQRRTREALYYIAEIISRFDVVAVQEVRGDLGDFKSLCHILGSWWKYLLTDITVGRQGNDERLAFLYNSRKVDFGGLAGQIVLPVPTKAKKPGKNAPPITELPKAYAFSRTPFQVGFNSGWFKFEICTTHAYYGTAKPDDPQRRLEIAQLARHLIERANDDAADRPWARHFILLGDFNIFKVTDETKRDLAQSGFVFPDELDVLTSGFSDPRHYDQIAFYTPGKMYGARLKKAAMGVFDFFDVVFRVGKDEKFHPESKKDKRGYRQWRTYQMSDHKPMWIAFATDSADAYLRAISEGKTSATAEDEKRARAEDG